MSQVLKNVENLGSLIQNQAVLEISDLPNGLYFVELKNDNSSFTRKVQIMH